MKLTITLSLFLTALFVYAATSFPGNAFNEQTRQAYAWIHGRMEIEAPDNFLEHAAFEGHKYALHPPLSAAVLMPVVAFSGMDTNQTWVSVVLGAWCVALIYIFLQDIWLTLFFAFGTTFWYEVATGTTWSLPSVVGTLFAFLTLRELLTERRGLWIGLWAGLAALGQYEYAFAMPVYAWMVWKGDAVQRRS